MSQTALLYGNYVKITCRISALLRNPYSCVAGFMSNGFSERTGEVLERHNDKRTLTLRTSTRPSEAKKNVYLVEIESLKDIM